MYCNKCGVELEKGVYKCPLCEYENIPIVKENRDGQYPEKVKNIYNTRNNLLSKKISKTFNYICFISLVLLIFQDYFLNKKMTWSYYLIPSFIIFIYVINVIIFRKFSVLYFSILYFLIAILLYFIDIKDGNITWFYSNAIKIILFLWILTISFVLRIKKRKRFTFKDFIYLLWLIAILILGLNLIINHKISWSIYVLIPLIIMILALNYTFKKFIIEIKKKLYI